MLFSVSVSKFPKHFLDHGIKKNRNLSIEVSRKGGSVTARLWACFTVQWCLLASKNRRSVWLLPPGAGKDWVQSGNVFLETIEQLLTKDSEGSDRLPGGLASKYFMCHSTFSWVIHACYPILSDNYFLYVVNRGICARMNLMPVPKKRDSLASASFVPYYMPALFHTMSSHAFQIQIFTNQFWYAT